nr:MAG TPA: hypothetical protein [Caudoviricetes sp.]
MRSLVLRVVRVLRRPWGRWPGRRIRLRRAWCRRLWLA